MRLGLITLVVDDYDSAIEFFVNVLGFDLVEDSPSQSERGQSKRWVVVRPAGAQRASSGPCRRSKAASDCREPS